MFEISPHASPADVAYLLMKSEARAMMARDLIDAVVGLLNLDKEDAAAKAKVYTSINLDPRLVFLGKGIWGIRDWSGAAIEAATTVPDLLPGERSYQPKAGDYLWDDEEDDDEVDELQAASSEEESEEPLV